MIPKATNMIDPKQSVASIVIAHSECAAVFQQLRIDFCCKGEQSLQLACSARKHSLPEVIDELVRAIDERDGKMDGPRDVSSLSNMALIAHIVVKHHDYLRKAMPIVGPLAEKVARVHGEHNPRLIAVREVVAGLVTALLPHLEFEETVLFPAMLVAVPDKAYLTTELVRMQTEHLAVGALLERLRDETEEFTLPDFACTSYKTLFAELKQLQFDTLQHVFLENHVLAPRFV